MAAHGCSITTQGRLIDHLRNTQAVGLEDLQALVLDEADRLLEMGFAEEVRQIPSHRQVCGALAVSGNGLDLPLVRRVADHGWVCSVLL